MIGERIFNLEKMFNYREGFSNEDDRLPERFFKDAHTYGKGEGKLATHADFDEWIGSYYSEREWDIKSSKPSTEKLKQLGLEFTT